MPYISSWCSIRPNTIWSNGQKVFEDKEAADAGAFFASAYRQLVEPAYPKFYKMDRLSQLGFLAAEVLLKGFFEKNALPAESVGVVLANSSASLDTDLRYFETAQAGAASPALFVYTLPNIVVGEICIRHRLKGENAFFVFEKYETPFLCGYIDGLLEEGDAQAVAGGWVDVLGEHFEAFLYLVETSQKAGSTPHNQRVIEDLMPPHPQILKSSNPHHGSTDAGT